MARIVSASDGPWSNGSTWVGGVVPGDRDSVQIKHAVTATGPVTVGPGGASGRAGTGTIALAMPGGGANGTVTGTGTAFTSQLKVGDLIHASGRLLQVKSIASDTSLTVTNTSGDLIHAGASFTYTPAAIVLKGAAARLMVDGGTLTVKGAIAHDQAVSGVVTVWTQQNGGRVEFDAPSGSYYPHAAIGCNGQYLKFRFAGTSGSRCYYGIKPGAAGACYFTNMEEYAGAYPDADSTDFAGLCAPNGEAFHLWNSNVWQSDFDIGVRFHDCTFDAACGEMKFQTFQNDAKCDIRRCRFAGAAGDRSISIQFNNSPAGGIARRISGCSFAKAFVSVGQKELEFGTNDEPNYLHDGYDLNWPSGEPASFRVFCRVTSADLGLVGDSIGNVLLWDGTAGWASASSPTIANNHGFNADGAASGTQEILRNLFLSAGVDGAGDVTIVARGDSPTPVTIEFSGNVAPPDMLDPRRHAGLFTHMGGANIRVVGYHNTIHSGWKSGFSEEAACTIAETGGGFAGSQGAYKSNLAWAGVAGHGVLMRQSGYPNPNIAAGFCTAAPGVSEPCVDYNACFGRRTSGFDVPANEKAPGPYDSVAAAFASKPGVHDLYDADPQFVDPTPTLAKWLTTWPDGPGQATTGTVKGDIQAAVAYIEANWAKDPAGLMASIRNYFGEAMRPRNPAYKAAHPSDGSTYWGDATTTDFLGTPLAGTIGALGWSDGKGQPGGSDSGEQNGVRQPLIAGTVNFSYAGPSGVSVTATEATGGEGPYTKQWQRSVNNGAWADLGGKTSLSLVDDTATKSGTLYGYRLVYTDSASTTVAGPARYVTFVDTDGGSSSGVSLVFLGIPTS